MLGARGGDPATAYQCDGDPATSIPITDHPAMGAPYDTQVADNRLFGQIVAQKIGINYFVILEQ
jgi:hypothetical protein